MVPEWNIQGESIYDAPGSSIIIKSSNWKARLGRPVKKLLIRQLFFPCTCLHLHLLQEFCNVLFVSVLIDARGLPFSSILQASFEKLLGLLNDIDRTTINVEYVDQELQLC